jgi:hypothetical protein
MSPEVSGLKPIRACALTGTFSVQLLGGAAGLPAFGSSRGAVEPG